MTTYKFSENNSGGRWWLNEKQYTALFAAGWKYEASEYDKKEGWDTESFCSDKNDPVPYGWRQNLTGEFGSMQEAVKSFEQATGQDFFAEGCNCCGAPFYISSDHEYLSGDSIERTPIRPW